METMKAEEILGRLKDVYELPAGGWVATCPAHPDKYRSLVLHWGNGGVMGRKMVLECYAGCSQTAVLDAMGLVVRDLYEELGPKETEEQMITGHEIGPAVMAEVTERVLAEVGKTVPEVTELPEVVPEGERLPEAVSESFPDGTRGERPDVTRGDGSPGPAGLRRTVPGVPPDAADEGPTAAEIQERMELTAADVNWKAREAERAAAGGESSMQRKRRLRKSRLVRKLRGWLVGCWPETDEEARVGCRWCQYRVRTKNGTVEDGGAAGDGGDDVAENELAGCEGVEEAMVPVKMLEDLRELLKLVQEDITK